MQAAVWAGAGAAVAWTLIVALRDLMRATASSGWPEIEATVTDHGQIGAGVGYRGGGARATAPYLAYEYTVAGMAYYGQVLLDPRIRGRLTAEPDAHSASALLIRYDPRRPQVHVCIPGVHWRQWLALFGAVVLLAIYVGVATLALRGRL